MLFYQRPRTLRACAADAPLGLPWGSPNVRKTLEKANKSMKKQDLGTPATLEPYFGVPGKALGVIPAQKHTQIQ